MNQSTSLPLAVVMLLVVATLAAIGCYLFPAQAPMWILAMLFLPAAWAAITWLPRLSGRARSANCEREAGDRASIHRALILAGVLMAGALALALIDKLALLGDSSGLIAERASGALMGVILVVYANDIPKLLTPLTRSRCSPANEQALRRFAGWTLVLGGLASIIAWLALPLAIAPTASIVAIALALAGLAVRVLWATSAAKPHSS
ncbi:MAG: hypothetical protein Tsb0020_02270 [Haliangiales bacterium]